MNNIESLLKTRKAIKSFDPSVITLSSSVIDHILEVANLTPSSYNMSPYRLVYLDEDTLKDKDFVYGPNLKNAKGAIVIATEHFSMKDQILDEENAIRRTKSSEAFFKDMSVKDWDTWSAKQAYMAITTILLHLQELQLASCPIEGIKAQNIASFSVFKSERLTPILIISIGYSLQTLQIHEKVRRNNVIKIVSRKNN